MTCDTVTNVRITDRAVEETIALDYNVQHAGIRELTFLLPAWLKDARIQVPLLRQKTIEPIGQSDKKRLPTPLFGCGSRCKTRCRGSSACWSRTTGC